MEELKTLKEIFEKDEKNASGFITATILRKEAIKHIKDLRRESLDSYWKNIHEKSAIPKIMEMFNLTEEDIK